MSILDLPTKQPIIQSRLNKAINDKWIFIFNLPEPLKRYNAQRNVGQNKIDSSSVQFSLVAVNSPSKIVKAVSQQYATANLYVSSHVEQPYPMLEITYNIDNNYANYNTLYQWMNLIHDGDLAIPDPKNLIRKSVLMQDYKTNVALIGLDEYNKVKIRITYTGAFPTEVPGISFDYRKSNEIIQTAKFAFDQFIIDFPDEIIIK